MMTGAQPCEYNKKPLNCIQLTLEQHGSTYTQNFFVVNTMVLHEHKLVEFTNAELWVQSANRKVIGRFQLCVEGQHP